MCVYVNQQSTESAPPNGKLSSVSRRFHFFLFHKKLYILFSISILIFWNSINLAYVSQLGNELIIFYLSKRVSICSRYVFFAIFLLIILSHFELLRIVLPKWTSSFLMEMVTNPPVLVDEFYLYMHNPIKVWFFEKHIWSSLSFSYSRKITCILLRQVISLMKMVVLSVKFTILIWWSPICIPLILLSALIKLASKSSTKLYKSMESRRPWLANIRTKGSDRRPLILNLDSILVYATLIMWMNFSPYLNLHKVEKVKWFLFSLFDSSVMSQIRTLVCTVKLFCFQYLLTGVHLL